MTFDQAQNRFMKWKDLNYCVLDTETTGLSEHSEICDIAVVDKYGRTVINTLIRPKNPIPQNTTDVHGITDKMVEKAPFFRDKAREILQILKKFDLILIYNSDYDRNLLAHRFMMETPSLLNEFRRIPAECVMRTYAGYKGCRPKKLSEVVPLYGISADGAHRALADVIMTNRLILAVQDEIASNHSIQGELF